MADYTDPSLSEDLQEMAEQATSALSQATEQVADYVAEVAEDISQSLNDGDSANLIVDESIQNNNEVISDNVEPIVNVAPVNVADPGPTYKIEDSADLVIIKKTTQGYTEPIVVVVLFVVVIAAVIFFVMQQKKKGEAVPTSDPEDEENDDGVVTSAVGDDVGQPLNEKYDEMKTEEQA